MVATWVLTSGFRAHDRAFSNPLLALIGYYLGAAPFEEDIPRFRVSADRRRGYRPGVGGAVQRLINK